MEVAGLDVKLGQPLPHSSPRRPRVRVIGPDPLRLILLEVEQPLLVTNLVALVQPLVSSGTDDDVSVDLVLRECDCPRRSSTRDLSRVDLGQIVPERVVYERRDVEQTHDIFGGGVEVVQPIDDE